MRTMHSARAGDASCGRRGRGQAHELPDRRRGPVAVGRRARVSDRALVAACLTPCGTSLLLVGAAVRSLVPGRGDLADPWGYPASQTVAHAGVDPPGQGTRVLARLPLEAAP